MLAEIKEREEAVEAREKELRAAGGERRTRTHSADPPRPRKHLPLARSDNTLDLDSSPELPPTGVETTKVSMQLASCDYTTLTATQSVTSTCQVACC
jgi:hypothetical protein